MLNVAADKAKTGTTTRQAAGESSSASSGAGSGAGASLARAVRGESHMGEGIESTIDYKRGMSDEQLSLKQRSHLHHYMEDKQAGQSAASGGHGASSSSNANGR
jgi:hypothetical protein